MSDVTLYFRNRHLVDPEPLPMREAVGAAVESLQLAWAADRRGVVVLAGIHAATATAQVSQLFLGREVVGAVLSGERARSQAGRVAALGALSLVARAGQSAGSSLQAPVAQAVSRRAQGKILDVVVGLELADVEDPGFQDRLQRALMGADGQSRLFGTTLAIPAATVDLVMAVAAMGSTDKVLAPLAVLGAIPHWVLTRRSLEPSMAFRGRSREMREAVNVRHYLTGAESAHELRLFDAAPFFRSRHDELTEEAARAQNAVIARNSRRMMLGSLATKAAEAPAAARLLMRVARKETALDEALTGGMAARRMGATFQRLFQIVTGLPRSASTVTDYRSFDHELPVPRGGAAPPRDFRRIVVEDVSFTYRGGERPVLEGVNLDIRQGEVVALVGENGSGKTTLAKVLCALYAPTKGRILWDAVDVTACDPAAVRSHIAVVFQDFVRYRSLTAAQNIGIGLPARMHDRAAIEEAARRAGAHDAIVALPDGYDTVLSRGFGGTNLSTGQWQRVALARAFLRDAPLVVLDEPTAALDPRAERDLFETVASLYRSRSALLISHRLSSVRFADRICVLAGGRITESGSHEALLAAGGTYAELFEMQARAYR